MIKDTGEPPGARARHGVARHLSAIMKVITDGAFVGLPVMIVLQVGNATLALGVYLFVFLVLVILATLGLRPQGGADPAALAADMGTEKPPIQIAGVALRALFTLVGAWAVVFGFFGLVRFFGKEADLGGLSGGILAASLAFSLLASIAVAIEPRGPVAPPPNGP